jgi:phosphotransferase system  glucose/maltose/N-acetylglucosamine-specific IIC component
MKSAIFSLLVAALLVAGIIYTFGSAVVAALPF